MASSRMGLRSLFPASIAGDEAPVSSPYCYCHLGANISATHEAPSNPDCRCGEWRQPRLAWSWDTQHKHPAVQVGGAIGDQLLQRVLFHPVFSAGTAVVRSDRPLVAGMINYFEVKLLTPMTGTDIMIGIGTQHICLVPPTHQFVSHLGLDDQSWGYSYRGVIQHAGVQRKYGRRRFSVSCIVGVLADLRHGRLEFYLNRKPLGVAYRNIPTGGETPLFAYATSTAAKSALKLIHASHNASNLQYACFKVLARSPHTVRQVQRVPGMRSLCADLFYLHTKELYAYAEQPNDAAERSLDEEALETTMETMQTTPRGFLDDDLLTNTTDTTTTATTVDGADARVDGDDDELDIYADLLATPHDLAASAGASHEDGANGVDSTLAKLPATLYDARSIITPEVVWSGLMF